MAIVKMKKFTLLTFESYKDELLKEMQKFEDVHFKNLLKDEVAELEFLKQDNSAEALNHDEAELAKIKFAMTKLEPYADKPKGLKAFTTPLAEMDFHSFDSYLGTYDYDGVYGALKEKDELANQVKAEVSKLRSENENLRTWLKLDVSLSELERMRTVKTLVGSVSKVATDSFKLQVEETYPTAYMEFLGEIKDDTTLLIVVPSDEFDDAFAFFKTLGFSRLSLNFKGIPSQLIAENNKQIEILQKSREKALASVKDLSGEYDKLKIAFDCYQTLLEREHACQNFLKSQTVVMIDGWVPQDNSSALTDIITSVCGSDYYLEQTEVEKDSLEVPIKLKNNKVVAAFEDVTTMFNLPKYNEMDPTGALMPFYWMFFGLMIGDTGYGLIILLGTSIALKFFTLTAGTRKFLQFFFYLSFAVIIAGFLYGSMFGFAFFTPAIHPVTGEPKAILDSQADVMTMIIGSVVLGGVQIIFGLLIKGYLLIRDGHVLAAISDSLFWIIALITGIAWLLSAAGMVPPDIANICKWVFIASLVGLAATQGRDAVTLGGKIASGIYSVYGISSYVGDFVSYTRIAALALSGAYIAFSFNLMADLVPRTEGIGIVIGWFFYALIFLVGQALNLGLSALGAYVHSCRLQYVEYFGKFYEGGGVPFVAFKIKNKFINIKK